MSDATAAGASGQTALEAAKILDALSVLGHDLACDDEAPPEQLVLPARKVREACGAIHHAVAALKRILQLSEARPDAPMPAPDGDGERQG